MAIARLAQQYGKYNQLDKDELDRNFGQMPHIQFTFDVETMGFKRIPNVRQVIIELNAKYSKSNLQDIAEDAEVVEIVDAVKERTKEINKKLTAHGDS